MKDSQRPDLKQFLRELEYAVHFRIRNFYPGRWPARGLSGGGFSFEKFEPLSSHPDFRRIDLLATGRNPLSKQPLVRLTKPTARVDIIMVADLSFSLLCGFAESKMAQMAKLATLFGYTAFRLGDRFGFLGFDRRPLENLHRPPLRSPTAGLEIGEEILDFRPTLPLGPAGPGLDLGKYLPEAKCLVLLVSDFYIRPESLRKILEGLDRHWILPIAIRQEPERRWSRRLFGIVPLRDAETKREKTVFFSSRSITRFEKKSKQNEKEIREMFRAHWTDPIFLEEIDPDGLLEELIGRGA